MSTAIGDKIIPNFKHFNSMAEYNQYVAQGKVDEYDICFVKEDGQIRVLGGVYGGSGTDEEALEAFVPMSRDFNDDFNNDYAR